MANAQPVPAPQDHAACGTVAGSGAAGRPKRSRGRTQPTVEIGPGVLSDDMMRGLIDDWLVPAMVESFIRELSTTSRTPRDES